MVVEFDEVLQLLIHVAKRTNFSKKTTQCSRRPNAVKEKQNEDELFYNIYDLLPSVSFSFFSAFLILSSNFF